MDEVEGLFVDGEDLFGVLEYAAFVVFFATDDVDGVMGLDGGEVFWEFFEVGGEFDDVVLLSLEIVNFE